MVAPVASNICFSSPLPISKDADVICAISVTFNLPSDAKDNLSVPPTLKSIWSSVSAVIDVSPSASKTSSPPFILSNSTGTLVVISLLPLWLVFLRQLAF